MLRVCALHLYGWLCDHEEVSQIAMQVRKWTNWADYPKSWPMPGRPSRPLGTAPFSRRVKEAADRRKAAIHKDLASAGPYYPREQVRQALAYWNVSV